MKRMKMVLTILGLMIFSTIQKGGPKQGSPWMDVTFHKVIGNRVDKISMVEFGSSLIEIEKYIKGGSEKNITRNKGRSSSSQ